MSESFVVLTLYPWIVPRASVGAFHVTSVYVIFRSSFEKHFIWTSRGAPAAGNICVCLCTLIYCVKL